MDLQGLSPVFTLILFVISVTSEQSALSNSAQELSGTLRDLAEDELDTQMLRGAAVERSISSVVSTLTDHISDSIQRHKLLLKKYVLDVEELVFGSNPIAQSSTEAYVRSCCDLSTNEMTYSSHYNTYIKEGTTCSTKTRATRLSDSQVLNLTRIFQQAELTPSAGSVKWRFFQGFNNTGNLQYPASYHCDDSPHHDVLFSHLVAVPRYVLILLDRGSTMTLNQMAISRNYIQALMSTLSSRDHIALVAVADTTFLPLTHECTLHGFKRFTVSEKLKLTKFLNVVQASKEKSDLALGFESLQEIVKNTKFEDGSLIDIKVLSNGNIGSFSGKGRLFETLDLFWSKAKGNRIVFSGLKVGNETDRISMDFMKKLSDQATQAGALGYFFEIKSYEDVKTNLHLLYPRIDTEKIPTAQHFSLFRKSAMSENTMFTLSQPIFKGGVIRGVFGFDLEAETLLEDAIHFSKSKNSFFCILEKIGSSIRVLFHPSISVKRQTIYIELNDVKDFAEVEKLYSKLNDLPVGHLVASNAGFQLNFHWRAIEGTQLIVMHVTRFSMIHSQPSSGNDQKNARTAPYPLGVRFSSVFNEDDSSNLCWNFQSQVSFSSGTLFFTSDALISPTYHVNSVESFSSHFNMRKSKIMAYLTDKTKLISNPGLREGTRDSATFLMNLVENWIAKMENVRTQPRIASRFAATSSGVYVTFPGIKISDTFEFSSQKWYKTAVENPGKLILTGPKLQSSGAGFVITVSESVQGERYLSNQELALPYHSVIGFEISLNYLEQLMTAVAPYCSDYSSTCFLFDQDGILLYHPLMTDPTYIGSIVDQHLNHKEPNVAKDILKFNNFVRKVKCINLEENSVRRYYSFNMDMQGEIHGSVNGRNCYSYSITALKGTNIFFGHLNTTCQMPVEFCPCNINNKECLMCPTNANEEEMAQSSCECPCECKLDASKSECDMMNPVSWIDRTLPFCDGNLNHAETPYMHFSPESNAENENSLQECFASSCSSLTTKTECDVMAGCAWCQVELYTDKKGPGVPTFRPISHPRCANQTTCFRGALGAPSPYKAIRGRENLLLERPLIKNATRSAVGPIVGGVLVIMLFLAFSVFCFRHRLVTSEGESTCTARRIWFRHSGQPGLRKGIEIEDEDDSLNGYQNQTAIPLTSVERPRAVSEVISPYKMNTGYRRPYPGTDSDHGYSTMTPLTGDLDSDVIMPYVASAPARDRFMRHHGPAASVNSVTSGVSSRTSSPAPSSVAIHPQKMHSYIATMSEEDNLLLDNERQSSECDPQMTRLNPNQFVVSVTVHMVDDTS